MLEKDISFKRGKKGREYIKKILADNIRDLMDYHGWTQEDVVQRSMAVSEKIGEIGITQKLVSNYLNLEDNGRSAKLDNIEVIANAFGLNAWCLLIPNVKANLLVKKRLHIKVK